MGTMPLSWGGWDFSEVISTETHDPLLNSGFLRTYQRGPPTAAPTPQSCQALPSTEPTLPAFGARLRGACMGFTANLQNTHSLGSCWRCIAWREERSSLSLMPLPVCVAWWVEGLVFSSTFSCHVPLCSAQNIQLYRAAPNSAIYFTS